MQTFAKLGEVAMFDTYLKILVEQLKDSKAVVVYTHSLDRPNANGVGFDRQLLAVLSVIVSFLTSIIMPAPSRGGWLSYRTGWC